VEINAFSEGQMQSRTKFRTTRSGFMPIKGDALSFGNVWKQKGRKTKTLIYEVTCKKEKKKKTI